jgi:hypothetical protein
MIEVALGLGGLAALIALLLKSKENKAPLTKTSGALDESDPKPYAIGLPESVKHTIIKKDRATKTELMIAGETASVAGFTLLGGALLEKAQGAPESMPIEGIPSPIEAITPQQWTEFIGKMRTAELGAEGKGRFGEFQMGVRRLVDFGIMGNPQKLADGTWTGFWTYPKEKFLKDPKIQYKLFERSMVAYRKVIMEKFLKAVNSQVQGRAATMSGLLAVAHFAGSQGLEKWLTSQELRRKFKATTNAYLSANNIF